MVNKATDFSSAEGASREYERSNHLIWISHDTPVYIPTISPRSIGFRLWSYMRTSGVVLLAPPIGKGVRYEDGDKYKTIREGFIEKKPWEQTARFKSALKEINRGGSRWGCKTEEDLRRRFYVDLPKLYESIKANGFLTQADLKAAGQAPLASRVGDGHEIKVGLNERGEFLFLDGSHRFGIAKILKIARIPVRVMFVHCGLQRERLRAIVGDIADTFPEAGSEIDTSTARIGGIAPRKGLVTLGNRPSRTLRRRNLIVASSLNVSGRTVLDVGCAEGLTSFYLADRAKSVIGIDHSTSMIETARGTAQLVNSRNVRFIQDDVRNEDLFGSLGKFDIAIAWGFLHRVADPFGLLYRLSELTDTLSLEWRTPVLPNMSSLSLAAHPRKGAKLDPMNIENPNNPGKEEKVEGSTAFWEMTPGAVKTILSRLGFTSFKVLGYGENFRREATVVSKKFNSAIFLESNGKVRDFKRERVHMIASRHDAKDWLSKEFQHTFSLPQWDFVAKDTIENEASENIR